MDEKKRVDKSEEEFDQRIDAMTGAVKTILQSVGENPEREGLLDTPVWYAKAMLFFTKGYDLTLKGR